MQDGAPFGGWKAVGDAAAACAWEFGDLDTHAQLMTWANQRYQPTAKDGEFYYQFGLDEPWPRGWPNDWLLMCVGEIEVTTTVDRHAFVIR